MNISILDDNIQLAKSIEKFFLKNGNHVDVFNTHKSFMDNKKFDYDVYIIDVDLGDGDGINVAKYLRNTAKTEAPILVISGFEGLETKLKGFKVGINDYIVKPFSPLELEARIKSIMKKSLPIIAKIQKTVYKDIVFDHEQRKILLGKEEIGLSKKEKQIAELFILHQDTFIAKTELIRSIWGNSYDSEKINNTLNVSICKIRKKMGDSFDLETINSEGYILKNRPNI